LKQASILLRGLSLFSLVKKALLREGFSGAPLYYLQTAEL
jgi:hypothetical protein